MESNAENFVKKFMEARKELGFASMGDWGTVCEECGHSDCDHHENAACMIPGCECVSFYVKQSELATKLRVVELKMYEALRELQEIIEEVK